MRDQRATLVENALNLARETGCDRTLVFLNTRQDCRWFMKSGFAAGSAIVLVIPKDLQIKEAECTENGLAMVRSWSGNQSRFSRIKYAFLHCVLQKVISADSRVVCVLGPWGKSHLDTITIHDLSLSWSEEFPFNPLSLIAHKGFNTIMAVVDIALDIGAMGREGSPVGTAFIIGDTEKVLTMSHQAVFNPFRGYPKQERMITGPEVVESMKELSKLDGAFIISETGIVEAAGRHLDARSVMTSKLKGFGSRHRSAAGITRMSGAVAVVVSESTGRVTVFEKGRIISTLEPVISRRLV